MLSRYKAWGSNRVPHIEEEVSIIFDLETQDFISEMVEPRVNPKFRQTDPQLVV